MQTSGLLVLMSAAAATVFLFWTAKREEQENLAFFEDSDWEYI